MQLLALASRSDISAPLVAITRADFNMHLFEYDSLSNSVAGDWTISQPRAFYDDPAWKSHLAVGGIVGKDRIFGFFEPVPATFTMRLESLALA